MISAEDCGINRMTFYYHFKDIYDLVEWSCQEDASRALAGKKTYETWQQGFLQILQAVLDNKPFILNVYRSVSREQVENYLYRVTYDLLESVVEEEAQGMSVRQEDKELIATLYKYLFVGLMLDWIKGGHEGRPTGDGAEAGAGAPRQCGGRPATDADGQACIKRSGMIKN